MPYIIIIRGPLGVGKSTIAKALAKKLNAIHIQIDKVLEENNLERKEGSYVPQDYIKANEFILPKIKQELKKGKIVILDGCFYFKEQIKHLEKNIPSKIFIFNLKAPVEICIKRDKKRKRVYDEDAARFIYMLVSKFDYGIKINIKNKSINQTTKEIITVIKNQKFKNTI